MTMTTHQKTVVTASDLRDEVQDRKESSEWDLRACPCCGARARVLQRENSVVIMCSRWLCREVEAITLPDAAYVWNLPRFTDK